MSFSGAFIRSAVSLALTAPLLAGCAGSSLPALPKLKDLNPFAEEEKILPGRRIPVTRETGSIGRIELASAAQPVTITPAAANADWSQPGGTASNAPGNLAYTGNASRVWSADIGTGSGTRAKLTTGPVVAGGRVFVMNADTSVSAYSAGSGKRVWRVSLVPEKERAGEGFGGGLAFEDGRLYAATGYGRVAALDPASGKLVWEQQTGVPMRASPTASGGQVFVVANDGRAFNLNGTDGSKLWEFRGLPQTTGLLSNPSPASSNGIVVFPFSSGDVVAVREAEGLPAWNDSVASTRTSSLGAVRDASRPVIDAGTVYAVGHSGRMIAADLTTGERKWSLDIPGVQPPAISSGVLFLVDLQGQLSALQASSGNALWTTKLPAGGKWSGPVLGSGRLWLTSSRGKLVSVDAATGRVLAQKDVGEPVYLAPVIAGGLMYVLTDRAKLIAYR